MRRTDRNTMTVDQENEFIRQCNHVKSIGAMVVYVDTGCRKSNTIKGVMVSSRRRGLEGQEKK